MPLTLFLASDIGTMINGEDGNGIFNKIFPNIGSLVVQLIATIILVFFVVKFFWKPIKKNIDIRREYIKNNIDEAGKLKEEAQLNLNTSTTKIKEATVQARRKIEEAEAEALLVRQKILKEAEEEAQRRIQLAEEQIAKEREEARQEIEKEIINVAMAAASKIVEREINSDDNERLVKEFLENNK